MTDGERAGDGAHEQTTFDILTAEDPDDASTPAESTLYDHVRDPTHPATKCGYCGFIAEAGFESSAGGRPFCPSCGAIPKDEQRNDPYGEVAHE